MTIERDSQSLDFCSIVQPGDTVMWGQAGAEPQTLTEALMAQRHRIGGFRVFLGAPATRTVQPEHADCVSFISYCGAGANRALAKAGKLDILPCHYSQFPRLIAERALPIDVLMLQVSPADEHGRHSLGIAHEYLVPALDAARVVIAEINALAPWTYGERSVAAADLDFVIHTARPPAELPASSPGAVERAIAAQAAALIEDGATLQFGLGGIPEAILAALDGHRDLGVHSGTIGDGAARLMQAGVITNARKSIDAGVTVTGIMMGTRAIYDFANRNPAIQLRSTRYTHDPDVLAGIDRFVALNSAIEVDLTGQINAEIAGGVYVGAVGGALDFLRGAARSKGGLPIVALPSTAGADRTSRIVATLNGPVSTPRSDVGIIITEYGVADLRGLTLAERTRRMIAIAHPDIRETLDRAASGREVA